MGNLSTPSVKRSFLGFVTALLLGIIMPGLINPANAVSRSWAGPTTSGGAFSTLTNWSATSAFVNGDVLTVGTITGTYDMNNVTTSPATTVGLTYSATATATFRSASAYTMTISPLVLSGSPGSITTGTNLDLSVAGASSISSGKTLTIGSGRAMTITGGTFTVTGTLVIDGSLTVSSGATLVVASGGLITQNGTVNNSGTITIQAGGTYNNNGSGTLNLNASSNFNVGNAGAAATFSHLSSNFSANATSTVTYTNTSGSETILPLSYGNLTLVGNGTKAFGAATTVKIFSTFTPGTLAAISLGNLSTIEFNGTGAQTVPASNYYNLTISGARTTNSVTLSGTINVAGTFNPAATFSTGGYIVTGSTVSFNGTTSQSIPVFNGTTGYNIVNNNNGSGVAVTLGGNVVIGGNLTFTGSGRMVSIGSNTLTLKGANTVVGMSTTNYFIGSATSNLVIQGTTNSNSIYMDVSSTANNTINSLTINQSSASFSVNMASNLTVRTLTLTQGKLDIQSLALTFFNTNIVRDGTTTVGTITTNGSSVINFGNATTVDAGAAFTIPAGVFNVSPLALASMIINRNNKLTLNSTPVTVSGNVNLVSGLVELGTGADFTIANAGSLTCTSPSASKMFITSATSGYLGWTFTTIANTTFTYPIGENVGTAEYSGFTFTMNANNTIRTVGFKVVDANPNNLNGSADYVSRYYGSELSAVTGTYTYTVSFPYNGSTGDVNGSESNMSAAYKSGSGSTWTGVGTVDATNDLIVFTGATNGTAPLATSTTVGNEFAAIKGGCPAPALPTTFNLSAISNSSAPVTLGGSVGLASTTNVSGIIVFANTTNTSAAPADATDYNVGDVLPSGAIVIYKGGTPSANMNFTYDASLTGGTDLSPNTFYYFNTYTYSSGASCNTIYSTTAVSGSTMPTITLGTASAATTCYNTSRTFTLSYTATGGAPDQYALIWNAAAISAGMVNNPSTAACGASNYVTLPASPFTFTIPAGVAPGTYTGYINPYNSSTGFDNCTYNGTGLTGLASFTVTVSAGTASPSGFTTQAVCPGATVADLTSTGTNLLWYATAIGGSPLATTTPLVSGNTYYGTQTVSGCESFARFVVNTITPVSGTVLVGTGQTFTTLTGAGGLFAAINTRGMGSNVTARITSDITETGANSLAQITEYCGSGYTLTITPNDATLKTLSGTVANPLIDFSGADNVTFDGRFNATGTTSYLTVSNSSATGYAFRFINDAKANTIKYCTLKGANTSSTGGVVFFSTAAVTSGTGNTDNTIDNCDIGPVSTSLGVAIYSAGSTGAGNRNRNTISNNLIHDYFVSAASSVGLSLGAGNTGWQITGNRFYQTASRTSVASSAQIIMSVTDDLASNPVNTLVDENILGYAASNGTGTYTMGSSSVTPQLIGIQLNAGSGKVDITDNKIQGINFSTNSGGNTSTGVFSGIYLLGSSTPNNVTGNYIGTHSNVGTAERITFNIWASSQTAGTSTGGNVFGIRSLSTATNVNISSNYIGNWVVNVGTGGATVQGISTTAGTMVADGNYIGSNSTTNNSSIQIAALGTFGATVPCAIMGIATTTTTGAQIIRNNVIGNFTNNSTSTNGNTGTPPALAGIWANSAVQYTITGNNIRNMTTATTPLNTQSGMASIILGIGVSSGSAAVLTVANNTITNLTCSGTATANGSNVYGIYFSGGTNSSNAIYSNYVNGVSLAGAATATSIETITGIGVAAGTSNVFNNMVKLGVSADNATSVTNAINVVGIDKPSLSAAKVYANTVYIRGTGVTAVTGVNSFALRRTSAVAGDDFRDNILINQRSNNSGVVSKHYALFLTSASTLVCDYNLYNASGTNGAVLASVASTDYTTLQALRASALAQNLNSAVAAVNSTELNFADLSIDLKLASPNSAVGAGTAVTTPFDNGLDKFGTTRAAAPTIGAHESTAVVTDIYAPVISADTISNKVVCLSGINTNYDVTITDYSTGVTGATLFYKLSTDAVWSSVTGTLNSGTATNGVWRFALNLPAAVTGQTYNYFVVAQDANANTAYNKFDANTVANLTTVTTQAVSLSFSIITPLSGTVTVGTGGTYTTFNGPSGLFAAINFYGLGGNLTVNVISDVAEGTNATTLNAYTEHCGTGYTVTVVPVSTTIRTIETATTHAAPMFKFNGVKRFIIDGRFGGSGRYLRLRHNRVTTTYQSTVNYNGGSADCILRSCLVEGANVGLNTTTSAGVIAIGGAGGTASGNISNITITDNLISNNSNNTPSLTNVPNYLVYVGGGSATATISNITITGNDMTNFQTSAVGVDNGGSLVNNSIGNGFNISNNNIYSVLGIPTYQYPIYFDALGNSYGHTISGNKIGGSSVPAPDITGTWSNTKTDGEIVAIYLNIGDAPTQAQATLIDNNKISNISLTGTGWGNFIGIRVENGRTTISNNLVGSLNSSLNAANITCAGGGDALNLVANTAVMGIWSQAAEETVIDNNIICGLQATASTGLCFFDGIAHGSNLYFNGTGYTSPAGKVTLTNNQVLYCRSNSRLQSIALGSPEGLMGVFCWTNAANNIIRGNRITNCGSLGGWNRNVRMHGMVLGVLGSTTAQTGVVERNQISYIFNESTGDNVSTPAVINPIIYGLSVGNGDWTISNNTVYLNNGTLGGSLLTSPNTAIRAINDGMLYNQANCAARYYNNTVYVSGSYSGTSGNASYAFLRFPVDYDLIANTAGAPVTLRNNIFINDRTGSGNHRALGNIATSNSDAAINWSSTASNYNFLASTSSSIVTLWGASTAYDLASFKTLSGGDANTTAATTTTGTSSATQVKPSELFVNLAALSNANLRINTTPPNAPYPYDFVSNKGTVTSNTDDIDGDTRTGTPDLGADEFFICVTPVVSGNTPTNPTCAGNDGTIALSGLAAGTAYTVTYDKNSTPVASASYTSNGSGVLTITGLGNGSYNNFVITAGPSCSSTAYPSSGTITLTNPVTPVVSSHTPTNPTCASGDGTIALTGLANSTTYSVTYNKNGTPVAAANFTSNGSGVVTIGSLTNGNYNNFVLTPVGGCASAAYPSSGTITLTNPVTPVVSSSTPTQPTCLGGGTDGSIALAGLANGTVYSVTYSKNGSPVAAANFTSNGSGVVTIGSLGAGSYTNFVLTPVGGCASAAYPSSGSVTLTTPVCGANTWQGDVIGNATDWFDAGNWSNNVVPNSCSADAIIPSSPSGGNNFPILTASASVGNITVLDNASITINSGRSLAVCGNWTGGTTSASTVTGAGNVVLTGNAAQTIAGRTGFTTLHVGKTTGTTATIQAGSFIDITTAVELESGTLATGSGTLTFKSTSTTQIAVLDNFSSGYTGTITGNITAERYYSTTGVTNQHYMGSPVVTTLAQFGAGSSSGFVTPKPTCDETALASTSVYGSVFSYDQSNGASCSLAGWKVEAGSQAATAAKGFSVTKSGSNVLSVSGAPNLTSSYSQAGTNSGWSNSSLQGRPMTAGWVLVSNPYLAYLDFTTQGAPSNFTSEVKVWRTTGPLAGTYQDLQPGEMIAPFQGFFVHSTAAGSYPINGNKRTRSTAGTFQAQANDQQLSILATNNSTTLADITMVAFNSDATTGFDNDYDAQKIAGTLGRHTLYTLGQNNLWMSKNIHKSIAETSTITMGFEPEVAGSYTFSFEGLNSFDPTSYIMLEDRKLGTMYNVRNGDYQFTADTADQWERFVLHFTPAAEITTVNENCSTPGNINVTQPGTAIWNYTIADVNNNNAVVATGTLNATTPINAVVSGGTYSITLVDNNNYTVVKMVTVTGTTPVNATFTSSATTIEEGNDVTFNSTTAAAVTTEWNFGDGTVDNTNYPNPTHTYSTPGTYTVTLTVTNRDGCTSTTTQTVTVTEKVETGIVNINNKSGINIWSHSNQVMIDFSKLAKTDVIVSIYNLLGQELVNEKYGRSTIYSKAILNVEASYVIVKVTNGDAITTKKVFIANTK